MSDQNTKPHIVIACGGTGGHLFPGLAVAQQFVRRNCEVTLIVSEKEIDQQALQNVWGMEIVKLPAVGLTGKNYPKFFFTFIKSFFAAKKLFKAKPPQAVIGMGGFTSAPPALAGILSKVPTFLHESNAVPGRANRWLSHLANRVFVGFSHAVSQFTGCDVVDIGMPVRAQFTPRDPGASRTTLGLDPALPTLLIMGGSQGAKAINDLVLGSLPQLMKLLPEFQYLHLTGTQDEDRVRQIYERFAPGKFCVKPFLPEMQLALSAATVAISRAGASSLAEIAALRVPTILIPYPAATDNHQHVNAQEYLRTGAARVLEQAEATPELLAQLVVTLAKNATVRQSLLVAVACWHRPRAAEAMAEQVLAEVRELKKQRV
jgi:UDP-N-acetylglucosamine--N-acetylmuramyl-(pentapeptide) pyrophosphoryl-undecaprenol N-acetylglucosamine transferase